MERVLSIDNLAGMRWRGRCLASNACSAASRPISPPMCYSDTASPTLPSPSAPPPSSRFSPNTPTLSYCSVSLNLGSFASVGIHVNWFLFVYLLLKMSKGIRMH